MIGICCSNQGEVGLIGNGKYNPPVRALKKITFFVVKQFFSDDVAATYQPHPVCGVDAGCVAQDICNPRPSRIYQHPCAHHPRLSARVFVDCDMP